MTYFQGFLIPVLENKKDAYVRMASDAAPIFEEFGTQRIVECWGDDVPHGETTDMYRGVNAEKGENIVFSWIEYESRAVFEAAYEKMMQDERMQTPPEDMPFDGMRMIYAGFEALGKKGGDGKTGYVQGYVAPVPRENKEAFAEMCSVMRDMAADHGALRAADSWGEDIEDGKITDFKRAVKAEDGEAVAFGFTEWPSKQAYEQGMEKMRADDRMPPPGSDMPLDGHRMIFGGFDVLLDTDQE